MKHFQLKVLILLAAALSLPSCASRKRMSKPQLRFVRQLDFGDSDKEKKDQNETAPLPFLINFGTDDDDNDDEDNEEIEAEYETFEEDDESSLLTTTTESNFVDKSEPSSERPRLDQDKSLLIPDIATVVMKNGSAVEASKVDFSQAERRADGKLCVVKDEVVESVIKEPLLKCTHQQLQKCHYTYVTTFKSSLEEVCDDNFMKHCHISFSHQAVNETVKKCYTPLNKVCNGQGVEECKIYYETACTTKYVATKQDNKFVADTSCERLPVQHCGKGCQVIDGPQECHDKIVPIIVQVPEEICDLNPQKTCKFATKLIPQLEPKHECTVVPKEVCHLQLGSPKVVRKPYKSEWCLDDAGTIQL